MFKKKTVKANYKVSEEALNLLVLEAMPKLKLSLPLTIDDACEVANYFYGIEADLANAQASYNEKIDEERLSLVCRVADEFNNELIDLDDLNSRLMKR